MRYIGIVFAISKSSGEYLKKEISETLTSRSIDFSIITDEQPLVHYQRASNLNETAYVLFESIKIIMGNVPDGESITIIVGANSVHAAFPQLRELIQQNSLSERINLISMIDSTVSEVLFSNCKKITVLGSTKTINNKLYHTPLSREHIDVIDLSSESQERINNFITKGIALLTPAEEQELIDIVKDHVKATEVDAIVFGCADLGGKFNTNNLHLQVIDSTDSLIVATVHSIAEEASCSRDCACK